VNKRGSVMGIGQVLFQELNRSLWLCTVLLYCLIEEFFRVLMVVRLVFVVVRCEVM
jgi:hypothetical protein